MCCSYMSPNTLSSCRSFPWPAAVQSTPVVNHSLPVLLSLYEPFLCHVIHKKSKVLETYSLYLACAFLVSGTKQNSSFLPTWLPTKSALTYLCCLCKVYIVAALSRHSNNTEHTVVSRAKCLHRTTLFSDSRGEDPRRDVNKKIWRKEDIQKVKFRLPCGSHAGKCSLKCVWTEFLCAELLRGVLLFSLLFRYSVFFFVRFSFLSK